MQKNGRNSLQKGDVNFANQLLSRTWSISGRVIRGKKLGRKLGYRTCNIRIKNYLLPKPGIYAVKVSLENKNRISKGVAYFGSRPTFNGKEIFKMKLEPSISTNPYIAFPFKVKETGTFEFEWIDDNGEKYTMSKNMEVI